MKEYVRSIWHLLEVTWTGTTIQMSNTSSARNQRRHDRDGGGHLPSLKSRSKTCRQRLVSHHGTRTAFQLVRVPWHVVVRVNNFVDKVDAEPVVVKVMMPRVKVNKTVKERIGLTSSPARYVFQLLHLGAGCLTHGVSSPVRFWIAS